MSSIPTKGCTVIIPTISSYSWATSVSSTLIKGCTNACSSRMVVRGAKHQVISPTLRKRECTGKCWESSQSWFIWTIRHGNIIRFVRVDTYGFPNLVHPFHLLQGLLIGRHKQGLLKYALYFSQVLHLYMNKFLVLHLHHHAYVSWDSSSTIVLWCHVPYVGHLLGTLKLLLFTF